MKAREWFEGIVSLQARISKLEGEVENAYVSTGPHGQRLGSIGGSSKRDALEAIDHIIDSGAMAELDEAKALLVRRLERATDVLYGRSGRGGLARARGYADADILCCHYLQGMGWAEIADEIVRTGAEHADDWCRMRAMRALGYIDRVGMERLADS